MPPEQAAAPLVVSWRPTIDPLRESASGRYANQSAMAAKHDGQRDSRRGGDLRRDQPPRRGRRGWRPATASGSRREQGSSAAAHAPIPGHAHAGSAAGTASPTRIAPSVAADEVFDVRRARRGGENEQGADFPKPRRQPMPARIGKNLFVVRRLRPARHHEQLARAGNFVGDTAEGYAVQEAVDEAVRVVGLDELLNRRGFGEQIADRHAPVGGLRARDARSRPGQSTRDLRRSRRARGTIRAFLRPVGPRPPNRIRAACWVTSFGGSRTAGARRENNVRSGAVKPRIFCRENRPIRTTATATRSKPPCARPGRRVPRSPNAGSRS